MAETNNDRIPKKTFQTPIAGFDLLKFIMALVIVNIHIQLVDVAEGSFIYVPWSYINDLAVPVFFILSSFFLFKKMREDDEKGSFKRLIHYEKRLLKLYLFWIVALSPIILFCWHREYLESYQGIFLFAKNFFFGYEFGASWFFGALLIGVPMVYFIGRYANDKVLLALTLLVYVYLYADLDNKNLCQLYTEYLRDPKLSFPAGLLWISIGKVLSNERISQMAEVARSGHLIMGVIVVALGSYFNDYNYVFRIPSVILLIGCFYKINIDNQSICRRICIYSTHFFCLHYSLIIVMQHLPKMYLDDKLIQMLEVLILCLLISNIIIYFKQFKYFSWLKYSM